MCTRGHDRITMNINSSNKVEEVDEIKSFQSARRISPPEAMWRIYGFCLNKMYPYVMSLQVHHFEPLHFLSTPALCQSN